MKRTSAMTRLMTVLAGALIATASGFAQGPAKKPLTFHAKVEAVDTAAKSVKVDGEKVAGYRPFEPAESPENQGHLSKSR